MRAKEQLMSWAMVAMMLLAVACGGSEEQPGNQPDEPQQPEEPVKPVKPSGAIKFSLDKGLTNTSFDQGTDGAVATAWANGDKIMIYCAEAANSTSETLTLGSVKQDEALHNQATRSMHWGKGDNHNFYAAYPATKISRAKSISLSIPSFQDAKAGAAPDKSLVNLVAASERVAPSESVDMSFVPAFSLLDISFTATEDVAVSRIVVRSTDSTPIAGDFEASYSGSKWQFAPTAGAENLSSVVALQINGSKGLELAAGEKAVFYAALMPMQYEALEVDVITSEGKVLRCEAEGKMEAAVCQKIEVGELPGIESSQWQSIGNSWMDYIPDDALLSDLTLVGTHDAASMGCSLEMSRCQSLGIAQQLEAGVRLFDLRPGKNFDIYHGIDPTGVKFSEALTDMVDFLNENPTQGCIVFIKNESGEADWGEGMSAELAQFADNMLKFKKGLTLGELRGKILVLSRDAYSGTIYGGFFSSGWPDNTADGEVGIGSYQGESLETFYLQDQYNSDTEEAVKIASIKKYADKAKSKSSGAWLCNHTSLAGFKILSFGSSPKDHAKNIHPEVVAYIDSKPGRLGIVMMDFAGDKSVGGDELLSTVINQNFRYKQSVK